jgi:hypothetical protein
MKVFVHRTLLFSLLLFVPVISQEKKKTGSKHKGETNFKGTDQSINWTRYFLFVIILLVLK